jgi:hypothetical protein
MQTIVFVVSKTLEVHPWCIQIAGDVEAHCVFTELAYKLFRRSLRHGRIRSRTSVDPKPIPIALIDGV